MTTTRPLLICLHLMFCCTYNINITIAGDTLLKAQCSNNSYALNSAYETNLNTLLSSISSNATKSQGKTRFFNSMVNWHDDDGRLYTIFGLYLCRGDDSNIDCKQCVPAAIKSVLQECPNQSLKATIWYVDCMVRYSNEPIFEIVDDSQPYFMTNEKNITNNNANAFSQLVGALMGIVANDASLSARKYATKKAKFSSFLTVYAEAQCTPDISINECQRCLIKANNIFPDCCSNSEGARVLTPSCNARYDIEPFFQNASALSPTILPSVPSNATSPPYLQLPPTNSPSAGGKKKTNYMTIALLAIAAILVVQVTVCIYLMWGRRWKRLEDAELHLQNNNQMTHLPSFDYIVDEDFLNVESLQYDLRILQIATNNFSDDNKLGEGGFGGVYKGILPNGQEIAVKRLAVSSNQGVEQFKNEVVFVAKLQHRNLVRLLGFCLAEYEKLLVYEFVPNKSLDVILFDPERQKELDWPTRYKIISGIARGMLYLHEDSRLKIVHRDLKASNILLDTEMNPKISDFGTARHFNVNESEAITSRIAGTFGYMAPEYLLHGEFSLKSDVYSFGVLILEIVSGRKSNSCRQSRIGEHIITFAWKHWIEGNPLKIICSPLGDSYSRSQAIRCIQLGLLCVQGNTEKRPTMASVIFSLNSNLDLPRPQDPGLLIYSKLIEPRLEMEDQLEKDESTSKSIRLSSCSSETLAY